MHTKHKANDNTLTPDFFSSGLLNYAFISNRQEMDVIDAYQ